MRRWAAIVALALSGWIAACGSRVEPFSPNANETPPTEPGEVGSRSTEADDEAAVLGSAEVVGWQLPLPDLDYNAREGRAVFLHYCAPCHGEGARGDGFNAYNLDPKPRDLVNAEFQAQHTDEDLVAVVRDGGAALGLSTAMPAWGRTLNERQVANTVRFIRAVAQQSEQRTED